ncbi:uncharacterized protein PpBr36_09570 [Pyricularia pennisetigena]|uniref:uncharacterized protein n=1 Tax=Pyricularia pennisetigena TaxID=1578925 RepID=UPI00114EF6AA|nr:uncharacterized protein PpBr36_09570 [Pyricularia pennisetigena]TLS21877.1 hypothetical protein PpBr36_09570 [Pyricularia pennisetigena]
MKFTVFSTALLFASGISAQAVRGANGNCGFPNGPDCIATGKTNDKGQREFQEPANSPGDDCCLFPARCGNGDGVAIFPCVKVGGRSTKNGKVVAAKGNGASARAKENAKFKREVPSLFQ